MKTLRGCRGHCNILSTFLIFSFLANAQSAELSGMTNAPTGGYASLSAATDLFTIELRTNGTYTVIVTNLMSTNSQSGVWNWDATKRQFSLKPDTTGTFSYELRLLRVDPRHPDTLRWIPLQGIGSAEGAIDYVRFKRKDEP